MGLTKEQIAELRREVPERLRAADGSTLRDSLPGAFSGDDAAAIRERVVGLNRTLKAEDASLEADAAAPTEQDLRNGSLREDRDADEEITRLAKAGLLAGQAREGYFGRDKRAESVRKTKEAQKRADQDMYMAALLSGLDDQIAALDLQIDGIQDARNYLAQTGDVSGAMEKPGVRDAIEEWEKKTGRKFDPKDPDAQKLLDRILDQKQQDLQAKRDTLAEFRERLKKNSEKALEATADGKEFKDPVAEELAKQRDKRRASEGKSPINRKNPTEEDLKDIKRALLSNDGNTQSKQIEINNLQQEISGVPSGNVKSVSENEIISTINQDIAQEDDKVGEYMKEYARIQLIEDPQERLIAEQAFVNNINNLPDDLITVGFALQEVKDIAPLFEEGYFDNLKASTETKHASTDQTQDRTTIPAPTTSNI